MIKIVPKKKVANEVLSYICAIVYIFIIIALFISLSLRNSRFLAAGVVSEVLMISFLVIVNFSFSWYRSAELKKGDKFLVYDIENIIGVLGKTRTRYEIKKVNSYKLKKNKLILYGDITVYEPLSKGAKCKKVIINDTTEESINYILSYFKI